MVSIVVPTLNEEENIRALVIRIDSVMRHHQILYEIIFIDDHSSDDTVRIIQDLSVAFPLKVYSKKGKSGKAFSLLEGFGYAMYEHICMIDADLQYPPEAIPVMLEKITSRSADVVVANRLHTHGKVLRKLFSYCFRYVFGSILFGLDVDVQSGLKVFKKEIINRIRCNPSPWTFDLEFLVQSKDAGYSIDSYDIEFTRRSSGSSKISLIKSSWEIALNAIRLKIKDSVIIPYSRNDTSKGFHYKGVRFNLYTTFHSERSAFFRMTLNQKLLIVLLFLLLANEAVKDFRYTVTVIVSLFTLMYFFDLLFNLYLIYRSFTRKPEVSIDPEELSVSDRVWPVYTIFCPLYKEWSVIPQFINAIKQMDYPKDKLQVILLLESDDKETIRQVKHHKLPSYFQSLIVPHSLPKTKPKACNYGLLHAKGEFVVIYDAEDVPDPLQLKKAVLAFDRLPQNTMCIQAKLNFYNPRQNLLTRLFTAEYSVWFDMILPGLQSIYAPIPLGGTSNHFRIADIRNLGAWDPFNVTEDADLGMRIMKSGGMTAILDSTTYEEANSHLGNWFKQRSRWIKGYIQTYFVHTRKPLSITIFFHLIIGGKVVSMLVNPLMWIMTLSYFILRDEIGMLIESIFPLGIFYLAAFSLVIGNFLYMYYYMIGIAKREQWDIAVYTLLTPFYWLCMSISAFMALWGYVYKPHYWHKTAHGLHIKKKAPILDQLIAPQVSTGGTIATT